MTREKGIKESIAKWKQIEKEIKGHCYQKWQLRYWVKCGYCVYYVSCGACTLTEREKVCGIPICIGSGDTSSHAYKALEFADSECYNRASEHCRIVLSFMEIDINIKRLRTIRNNMKQRCYNEKCPSFKNYGGKNVTMFRGWRNDFNTFRRWSIVNGYREHLVLDRIKHFGNYGPVNCEWITKEEYHEKRKMGSTS